MIIRLIGATVLLLVPTMHYGTTLVTSSSSSSPYTFSQSVTAKVLDRATGTFYAGLAAGAGDFSVAKATRPISGTPPTFSAIGSASTITNLGIEFLTMATSRGNLSGSLALVLKGSTAFRQTKVTALSTDGSVTTTSSTLIDAGGAIDQNGLSTFGIVGLAANESFMFAAVRPSSLTSPATGTNFGNPDSGIAVVAIAPSTLALEQTAAQPGDTGIKAALFDPTCSFISIQSASTMVKNQIALIWDDQLQRLYAGIGATTANSMAGDGCYGVVPGSVSDDGILTFSPFVTSSALVNGQSNALIAATQSAGTPLSLNVANLGVLHASTGPSYLIINGGNGTASTNSNLIFALPLVDKNNRLDSAQGLLADKNSFDTSAHRFTQPVSSNAGLTLSSDIFAQVGAGPLPIESDTPISDMVVVGDTVYVSIDVDTSTTNDTGILYSQALFDQTGRIVAWTPWTKRAFPYNGFNTAPVVGTIALFDVDASAGIIWAVNDLNDRSVRVTSWDAGQSDPASLTAVINVAFGGSPATPSVPRKPTRHPVGCYSVLDLDQSTRGFTGATTSRYALFGGPSQVAFALTSRAATATIDSPQTVTLDYSSPTDFILTGLAPNAGPVTCLEYSRQLAGSSNNFFFAGTNTGLYAFARADGIGFDAAQLENLDQAPFTTSFWQKIEQVSGAVIDIKTSGQALYVLTFSSSPSAPLSSTLYRFPFASSLNGIFNNGSVIARSSQGTFASVSLFTGMQIISTASDGSTEQLVLATNKGLYESQASAGVQSATSPEQASWQAINNAQSISYNAIGYIDNALQPSTVWPVSTINRSSCRLYNSGSFEQLAGNRNDLLCALVPEEFMAIDQNNPTIGEYNPVSYFWSDGARRFIIMNTLNKTPFSRTQNGLFIVPYDTIEWNVSDLSEQEVANAITQSKTFWYWVRTIGATGTIMAGTNSGVIALE